MDPRDPSQRPSIFKKPEPTDETGPTDPTVDVPSPEPASRTRPNRAPAAGAGAGLLAPISRRASGRPYSQPPEQSGPSRRLVMGLAFGGALLLLVIGGFIVTTLLRPNDALVGAALSVRHAISDGRFVDRAHRDGSADSHPGAHSRADAGGPAPGGPGRCMGHRCGR